MKDLDQYYKILELDPGASLEQIKQAYRDLARVWHPDRFSHDIRLQEKAQEKMKEINEAYEQLQSFYKNVYIHNSFSKTKYQESKSEKETTSEQKKQAQAENYPFSKNVFLKQINYRRLILIIISIIFIVMLFNIFQSEKKVIPIEEDSHGIKLGRNLVDQDGNTIEIVVIGNQELMTKNLAVEHYRNGDPIPQVQDKDEWGKLKTGAWCYYDNDPDNGKKYGKLYNWYAVNDPRGLAPEGWHLPSYIEFQTLKRAVNKNGNALKAINQGTNNEYGNGAGTNTSSFSALLTGSRGHNSDFVNIGNYTSFWSSTEANTNNAYIMYLAFYGEDIYLCPFNKEYGFSVRCVKN
jgi:uncharacterized protein (TIGR02145 family)